MNFVSQYSFGFYLLCILVGAIYAFLLYRKDRRLAEFSKPLIALLAFLRLISVSMIAMLLLGPLIKYMSKTVEKPTLVLALDQSASMKFHEEGYKPNYDSIMGVLQNELEDEYELVNYTFDEQLQDWEPPTAFDGKLTNYEALISGIHERYLNRNLGGVILISDGIFNRGTNPLYLKNKMDFPIFALASGDTNRLKDGKIQSVRNNKIAFLGNDFPFEIDLTVEGGREENLNLKLFHKEEEVFSEIIKVDETSFFTTIKGKLEAKELGMQKYSLLLQSMENEKNSLNNRHDFYIDVLDGRQKIALLAAAPHPDIRAIKESLSRNENYVLTTALFDQFREKADDFDLLVLHAYSVVANSKAESIIKAIRDSEVPLLVFGSFSPQWEGIIPINSAGREMKQQAFFELNQAFTLFTVSEKLQKQFTNFPPLEVMPSSRKGLEPASIMGYQKIGEVSTKNPLMAFYKLQNRKVGRFYGMGIWRWRIYDYASNKDHKQFDEWMNKTIQYLALKSDRSFFRLNVKREFYENEEIVFDAQLFNQSYELINDVEVSLTILNEANESFNYTMNPYNQAYRLKVPALASGSYRYHAEVQLESNSYAEEGSFVVKALQLENLERVADHNLLYQIAKSSSGSFLPIENFSELPQQIDQREDVKPISYINENLVEVINLQWLLFIIVGLLSLEWFIRKYGGAY